MLKSGAFRKIIAVIVTVAMLVYIFVTIDFASVVSQYLKLSLADCLTLLILMILNIVVGTKRLERILHYFERKQVRYLEVFRANISGLLASLVFINIFGSLLGRHHVLRRQDVSVAALAAMITAERVLIIFVGGILLSVGLATLFGMQSLLTVIYKVALLEVVSAISMAVVAIFVIFLWRREIRLFRKFVSVHYTLRFANLTFLTFVAQAIMISTYVYAATALGVQDIGWFELAAAAAIISFAAGLPISINGWGIREVSAIYAFGQLGVGAPEAAAISILVGLVSTAAVIVSSPVLLLRQTGKRIESLVPSLRGRKVYQELDAVNTNTVFFLIAGPLAVLLVFVTLHIPLHDTFVAINLADPLAVLSISFAGLSWISSGQKPFHFPKIFSWWLIFLTLLIVLGFLHGVWIFGVTDWALNNRLFGWILILGYLSLGALMIETWGHHGLRRIAEVALTTGAVIGLFDLIHREIYQFIDVSAFIAGNYEGFSMNRNAFAFQLLIAASAGLAYSKVFARTRLSTIFSLLLAVVFVGVLRTYSMTGLITGIFLVLVMLVLRLADVRIVLKSLSWIVLLVGLVWALRWGLGFLLLADTPDIVNAAPRLYIPSSQAERWMTFGRGLEVWLQNPFFGGGLGAFTNLRLGEEGRIVVIHSVPVWFLAEFGIIGFVLVASLPVAVFIRGIRWRLLSAPPHVAFLIAATVCFLVFGLTHDIFYQRIYWIVLGGCAAALAGRRRPYRTRSDFFRQAGT